MESMCPKKWTGVKIKFDRCKEIIGHFLDRCPILFLGNIALLVAYMGLS
jgi:hypothetical protein